MVRFFAGSSLRVACPLGHKDFMPAAPETGGISCTDGGPTDWGYADIAASPSLWKA